GDALVFLDPGKPMGFFDLDTLISDAFVFGGATVDRMGNLGISSGDINNDGYIDLLIGAPLARYSFGVRTNCGKGYLASGRMISLGDRDGDGFFGCLDNCPTLFNSSQADVDGDNVGDDCDNCAFTANSDQADLDSDGVGDSCDNCPSVVNPIQADSDSDGLGNVCDNCKLHFNPAQIDDDGDSYGNDCDPCPFDFSNTCCTLRGDPDNSGDVNIGDAIYIVEFVFQDGPAPVFPGSGDPNCSGAVEISDAIFLIDYIFSNGFPPCCMP
ncbi:MAG: thrombospondin type 3 repeat-containing protein, partial [candidate division Zixibacteria bacterium]|nr:thrombospondin type 3 repeat-containing protein [candidate division Zixibacteria bacterium]